MKLKSLVVITLLVLGCSAAYGQNLGFLSYTGGVEYCNYESMTIGGGGNFYLQGYDVLTACPYSPVPAASIEGFKIGVPLAAGSPVHGASYVYADQIYDAYYLSYTGLQWMVITKNKAPKKIKVGAYGWAGYVGVAGYEFLGNWGYLTNTLPSAAAKSGKVGKSTISNMSMAKLRQKAASLKANKQ